MSSVNGPGLEIILKSMVLDKVRQAHGVLGIAKLVGVVEVR
jgi:hypothetical protein